MPDSNAINIPQIEESNLILKTAIAMKLLSRQCLMYLSLKDGNKLVCMTVVCLWHVWLVLYTLIYESRSQPALVNLTLTCPRNRCYKSPPLVASEPNR